MFNVDHQRSGCLRWRVVAGLLSARQWLQFVLLTLTRIVVGFCDIAVAAATYWLFQLLEQRPSAQRFPWIPHTVLDAALLSSFLVVVRASVDLASSRSVFHWIQRLHGDFLLQLTRGYSELKWTRFVRRNRAELLHHTIDTTREAADFYHRCLELIAGVAIVAAMAAALVVESATAALGFSCAVAAFYGLHRLLIRNGVQQAAAGREVSLNRLRKIVTGVFASAREIRAYDIHSFFRRRIRNEAEAYAAHHRRAVFLPQFARIAADQGAVLLFLGLIAVAAAQHGDPRRLLSLLAFYFVLSRRLLPLLSQLSLVAGQMEGCWENVRILEAELAECRDHRTQAPAAPLPRHGFVLELHHVSFWYHADKPLLRSVDFRLRAGEVAVLHGASGMGKTSLLNLIAGVLQPVNGCICVDRSSIACVPQEVFLLDDSIRNNLLFGLTPRCDEDLMRALSLAGLADDVSTQPGGLDTQIGDNGALLSGGQRQRLGLARAILRGSGLLLLDEATAALDPENERRILAGLSARGAAILLVSHHPHVSTFAHRVYRLHNGCLREETPQDSELPATAVASRTRTPVAAHR